MITPEVKEQILGVARIEEVIGDVVSLKKRGANMIGRCPFHNEKTPSFTVSPAKGLFKCFGCGKGGDVITFVMEFEQLPYPDALKQIAGRYGITIEEKEYTPRQLDESRRKESLYILINTAANYYVSKLHDTEEGQKQILPYLLQRGLTMPLIEKFQLGWAPPGKNDLLHHLLRMDYTQEQLEETGLIFKTEDGTLLDRFRERIIFPIHNAGGKPVAFGGRIVRKDQGGGKYINSPETELYHKSEVLYGLHLAKTAIRKRNEAILTEGYMDVIAMHGAGYDNTISSSGTSFTPEQARLIKRHSPHLTILFDGDEAGQNASRRAIEIALEAELDVSFITLPGEHDPDSFTKAFDYDHIEQYFQANKQNWLQWLVSRLPEAERKDPKRSGELAHEALGLLLLEQDAIRRALLLKQLAEELNLPEDLLQKQLLLKHEQKRKARGAAPRPENAQWETRDAPQEQPTLATLSPPDMLAREIVRQESAIMRVLLNYGHNPFGETEETLRGHYINELAEYDWSTPELSKLFEYLSLKSVESPAPFDAAADIPAEDLLVKKLATELMVDKYDISEQWDARLQRVVCRPDSGFQNDAASAFIHLNLRKLSWRLLTLQEEMRENTEADEEAQTYNLALQMGILEERKEMAAKLGSNILF